MRQQISLKQKAWAAALAHMPVSMLASGSRLTTLPILKSPWLFMKGVHIVQEQDEGILQQQLQQEEQQKEKVSSDKARVDTLALNIKHWRSRAREAHECFTCRRKLNAAEMVTFMQIQASRIAALHTECELQTMVRSAQCHESALMSWASPVCAMWSMCPVLFQDVAAPRMRETDLWTS